MSVNTRARKLHFCAPLQTGSEDLNFQSKNRRHRIHGGQMVTGEQEVVMRRQMRHHPVAIWNTDDAAIQTIRTRILRITRQFALHHGHGFHARMQFRQSYRPDGKSRINGAGCLRNDAPHLIPQGPFAGKTLRNDAHVSTMRHQDVIAGITIHLGKFRYPFMFQCRLSHEKGIEIRHHDWRLQGAVQNDLRHHGQPGLRPDEEADLADFAAGL